MKRAILLSSLLALSGTFLIFQTGSTSHGEKKQIESQIVKEKNGDVFMIQTIHTTASIDKVWEAYTTEKAWKQWVAPVVKMDFKIGGKIQSNYRPDGKITDPDTIQINIINYVPKKVITYQAVAAEHWPKALKDQEKRMYNIVTFEETKTGTKMVSYGTGYTNSPEMQNLLKFFVSANEMTFKKLIQYLEK